MKAVIYEEFGSPQVLKVAERDVPDIGSEQVLLEVAAAGVNPIDRRLRSGELSDFFQYSWPVTPGWDVAGRVKAVGSEVTKWQVGDAVCGLGFTWNVGAGSYAEYMAIDADSLAPKPDNLSFIEAAALPLVSLTAWQSLAESSAVKEGSKVFIQAGAGGIGSVSLAIAKHLGAETYTTTREKNFDYVRARGADHPIDYKTTNYVHELKALAPEGMDVVLEALETKIHVENAIRIAADGGRVIYMNNEPPEMPEIERRGIHAEWLHHRADGKMLTELMALYGAEKLTLPEISTMALDDAVQAHQQSESGRTRGKLVLEIAAL